MTKEPVVVVEFKWMPDLIIGLDEYKEMGGYRGMLKQFSISPRDIKKVHNKLLKPEQFPTQAWEG